MIVVVLKILSNNKNNILISNKDNILISDK